MRLPRRTGQSAAERAVIERAWERIQPLVLYRQPIDTRRVRILTMPWLFRVPWFRRFDGYTIWSTILLRWPMEEVDGELIAHELVHVWQSQHEWIRLWLSYVKPSTFFGDRSGYWENPYELEARSAVTRTAGSTFDRQPVLRSDLLVLRPLRAADFDALYAVARDPLLWAQHPVPDRHRPEVFGEFFDDALSSGGALTISTVDGTVIGSSRYHGYDAQRREVEIGWTFLARSHWGGETNRNLKALMLGHAFRSVDRVVFRVGTNNLRSQRALEKLGAQRIGTQVDESGQPNVWFAIDRNE